MKPPIHLLLLAQLLTPVMCPAADLQAVTANEVEFGLTHDALDNGYADWESAYLDVVHRLGARHAVYGELRETQRFNLRDREMSVGYSHPFSATWTGLVEASVSPDHNVLARNSVFGQLQKSFDDGWGVQAGLRRSEYNSSSTELMVLTGERYWGNYRGAYTFYLGRPQDAGAAPSHLGQLSYYYDERSYLTFGVSSGRQVESLGPGLGVLVTDVTSVSFSGRHWLDSGWGISYEAVVEHQGDLYTRKGMRMGLRHAF
jgi:YaiO family outer membrane protein